MIAHSSTSDQEEILSRQPLNRLTSHTIVQPQKLRMLFEEIKINGFAIEKDETDIGVTCIGAPVFENNTVIAAISLSAPSARVDVKAQKELVKEVRGAATALTKALKKQESLS
jgi:IclR family acetate operon transcriptional repressor/IclR family KDG regulon transcriptional repressor